MGSSFERICPTEVDLVKAGEEIGILLRPGDVVALDGVMGAGKTTLTKGIARALSIQETVTSPTFAIMSIYQGKCTLVHIDAYRLEQPEQLDIEAYVKGSKIIIIEWPENLPEMRNLVTKKVKISVQADETRIVTMEYV